MESHSPLPVTLLTGFLGSGKTTVLNHLVRTLPRTAILMNEFGEVALDHQLLQKMEGPMALLSGGCVCCTISGSLSPTLKNLWMARQKGDIPAFERVIIEATGVADPVPVLDNLLHDNWVRARFRLDGVITTVDAVFGMGQLDTHFEAVKQVAADLPIMAGYDDGYERSAPVGSFDPNPWGLHDMIGNVSEWTADWYAEDYYSNSPERNPIGPFSDKYKVIRGGSWHNGPLGVRSAYRRNSQPGYRYDHFGYRCAQTPSAPSSGN